MENIQLSHSHHHAKNIKSPVSFLAHDSDVPMNIGSLFRIADALGVEKIYLLGSSLVPPNAKIRKTSRATEKFVPFSYEENLNDIISKLKSLEIVIKTTLMGFTPKPSQAVKQFILKVHGKI